MSLDEHPSQARQWTEVPHLIRLLAFPCLLTDRELRGGAQKAGSCRISHGQGCGCEFLAKPKIYGTLCLPDNGQVSGWYNRPQEPV